MRSTEERNKRGPLILISLVFLGALLATGAIIGITHLLAQPQQQVASAAASQLLGPAVGAKDDQVRSAVQAAQATIAQSVTANPDTDVSTIPLQEPYKGITVTAAGTGSAYTVTGRNTASGFAYTYNSTTGSYVSVG